MILLEACISQRVSWQTEEMKGIQSLSGESNLKHKHFPEDVLECVTVTSDMSFSKYSFLLTD